MANSSTSVRPAKSIYMVSSHPSVSLIGPLHVPTSICRNSFWDNETFTSAKQMLSFLAKLRNIIVITEDFDKGNVIFIIFHLKKNEKFSIIFHFFKVRFKPNLIFHFFHSLVETPGFNFFFTFFYLWSGPRPQLWSDGILF